MIFTFFFILSLISQIIFNEWVFHLNTRGESYLKRKKKKTSLLYSSLSSILTKQDGKIPRIYKPFLPLWLWLIHLLTNCWLFSQKMKEIKRTLTLHLFISFLLPCSCHFPQPFPPSLLRGSSVSRLAALGRWLKSFFHKQFMKWFEFSNNNLWFAILN